MTRIHGDFRTRLLPLLLPCPSQIGGTISEGERPVNKTTDLKMLLDLRPSGSIHSPMLFF